MAAVWRTRDTARYIQAEWSKSHDEPIDEGELLLFLCDEHRGNLTEEQKSLARRCRDEMRTAYGAVIFRLVLCEEMLSRGMAAYRVVLDRTLFFPEGGDAPWLANRAV